MADWYGMARSNYFRVKDEAAFRKWAEGLELALTTDDAGRFGFYSITEDGGFPSERFGKDGEEVLDLDLAAELATHLEEGDIAVLMEVGHEKARYASGSALAVNNQGKQISLTLSDIYEKAAEFFDIDVTNISAATY